MEQNKNNLPAVPPVKKKSHACLFILIIVAVLFLLLLMIGGSWLLWREIESVDKNSAVVESSLNDLKKDLKDVKDQVEQMKRKQTSSDQSTDKTSTTTEENSSTSTEAVVSSACDFSKSVSLKAAATYDIFGGDIFDTVVCGYLVTKEEEVWEQKQTSAYLAITKFYHEDFKKSLAKGITEGNGVNQQTADGAYLFNLGCQQSGKISGRDYETGVPYLDETAQINIQNSTKDKPVALILSFGKHEGMGCSCCNLAHKIRTY